MSFVGAIIAVVAVYALIRIGLFRLADLADRARTRLEHANEFYRAANTLLSDADTPQDVLRFIQALNETINDPAGPRILMSWLLRGQQLQPSNDALALNKVTREFFEKRPELAPTWEAILRNWFLSVSYFSSWRGPILRGLINDERLIGAAKRVSKTPSRRRPSNDNHHASMGERAAA